MYEQKQWDISLTIASSDGKVVQTYVSNNTLKAYRHATHKLAAWLNGRTLTDQVLAEYITALYAQGKSPATIKLLVSAVKWTAECHGVNDLVGTATARTQSDIRQKGTGRGRGQVTGLTWTDVKQMCSSAEASNTLAGLRDSAMINLMSNCLLRISGAVSVNVGDLHEGRLRVRVNKASPEERSERIYVSEPTNQAISRYRRRAGIEDGALFRRVRFQQNLGQGRLSVNGARDAIKRWAREAGVEGFISSHSLRVGSAISLACAGATVAELQAAGRWKSPMMPAHYARSALAAKA